MNWKKYRKKPVVIDAIQFDGNYQAVFDWVAQWHDEDDGPGMWESKDAWQTLIILTLEGEMKADKGDWIIRGIKGEFYPCKPDIFEATYDEV